MNLKRKFLLAFMAILCFNSINAISFDKIPLWVSDAMKVVNSQCEFMSRRVLSSKKFPRSHQYCQVDSKDWTSGFFPGTLWYLYEYTNDNEWRARADSITMMLFDEQYNAKDHDIGFRMYCSFGNGYRLTKNEIFQNVYVRAAKTLSSRFSYKTGLIMSWEPNKERDWKYPVIIDNMMNLEMMMRAGKDTNDKYLIEIAKSHADKTMKFQYRKDFSCPHVVDYDSETGVMRKYDWNNGSKDPNTSVWSRGQSWGLYGYTMMYRETKNSAYLKHAENIAGFLLNHPSLPSDMIPYWDYSGSKISQLRDSSAASIMASALLELSLYSKNGQEYFNAAEKILKTLSSTEYLSKIGENKDFVLKHATGNCMFNSELDGALVYGDYYYVEALIRYLKVINKNDLF